MSKKRAIIVGAGIGGLTMAIRLARKGWQVEIHEARNYPGGRLGFVEGDGYRFDLGPTIVLMPDVFRSFFAELGMNMEDHLTFKQLDPNYRLHFADGTHFDASANLQRMMNEIARISPSDLNGFMKYLAYMYRRYRIARHDFIEQPMLSVKELLNPVVIKKLIQLHTLRSMNHDISRFIHDERLQTALTFQSLYIGIDPFEAPSIYNVIGFMELSYSGVWYCEGGYHRVAEVFARLAAQYGVEIHYGSKVEQIITENQKAKSVRLHNGQIIPASIVVVNADYPKAVKALLNEENRGKVSEEKIDKMRLSCSAFMMYLGSKQRYPHANVHNVYFSRDFKENMDQLFHAPRLPDHPSFYVHVPSLIDASVAPPDREAIYVLVPVANNRSGIDWKKATPVLREHVLRRMEDAGFHDLTNQLEYEHIVTPDDWERDLSLEMGATFGVLPTLRQSAYWRPSLKSKEIEGLYFLGASTHPGGGVPIVMTGAASLDKVISRDFPEMSVRSAVVNPVISVGVGEEIG